MEIINKPKVRFDANEVQFIKDFADQVYDWCEEAEKHIDDSFGYTCNNCVFAPFCNAIGCYSDSNEVVLDILDKMINCEDDVADLVITGEVK